MQSKPMSFYLLLFFLTVGIVVFYVWERVTAVRLTILSEKMREEVTALENELNSLKIQLSSLSSSKRLEPLAKSLGMTYP